MKISHRIVLFESNGSRARKKLDSLGFSLESDTPTVFFVDESDHRLSQVESILTRAKHTRSLMSEYSESDFTNASLFVCDVVWLNDYPQPEDEYVENTFDAQSLCQQCHANRLQVSSYRLKRVPKWGRRNFMGIGSEFDVLFTRLKTWEALFAPIGIQKRAVENKSGKEVIDTVVQLEIPILSDVEFKMSEVLPHEICSECQTTKYEHIKDGCFPELNKTCDLPIFKPSTLFGSGWSAVNLIVVNKDMYTKINEYGANGLRFFPIGITRN